MQIEDRGASYAVVDPEVVDAEAGFPVLPPRFRRAWRLFRMERFLKLKQLPEVITAEDRRPGEYAKIESLSS